MKKERWPQVDPHRLKALRDRTTWIRVHLDDVTKQIEKGVPPGAEIAGDTAEAIGEIVSLLDIVVQTAQLAKRDALILGVPAVNEIELVDTE